MCTYLVGSLCRETSNTSTGGASRSSKSGPKHIRQTYASKPLSREGVFEGGRKKIKEKENPPIFSSIHSNKQYVISQKVYL